MTVRLVSLFEASRRLDVERKTARALLDQVTEPFAETATGLLWREEDVERARSVFVRKRKRRPGGGPGSVPVDRAS